MIRSSGPQRTVLALVVASVLIGCGAPTPDRPEFTLPPEWEAHEAVWFTYTGTAPDTVLDQVVLEMDTATLIVCAVDGDSLAKTIMARWDSLGIAGHRYRMEVLSDSLSGPCVRDAGPIFLRQRDGSLAILDADWNYYGDHENVIGASEALLAFEDSFPTMLARRMGLPVLRSPLVIEGGACEINGRGDLLQVEAVTLQRNPGWSKDSIAAELKRVFGARRITWLKHGPVDDMWFLEPRIHGKVFNQGTGGHVDEFCRFVNDSTVLLAWPDDDELRDSVQLFTRLRMAVNLRILEEAGLTVVQVPTPPTEYYAHRVDSLRDYDQRVLRNYADIHHGDTIQYIPAASYLNFLVTNGHVFIPSYWHEGLNDLVKAKDERVRAILAQHFPDRRIVHMDPRAINWQGGGLHCWTQQQPRIR